MTYSADQMISGLDAGTQPVGADPYVAYQGGEAVQLTHTQLMAAIIAILGDTDGTLAGNSASRIAVQSAVKSYVDAKVAGLSWKGQVRARTTGALPANTYANGTSGVGATLTGNSNAALAAQDGVTLAANDRLLVANEATGANNGIYVVTQVGSVSLPYILTRATDANTGAGLVDASCYVAEGTTYADTQQVCTTNAPITVGSTALVFTQFSSGSSFTGGTLTSALNEAPTVTIASSSTPAIGAAAGNSILMTGTVTVTGFDTIAAGAFRRVRFAAALILTYNATSLILPTSANITTAANDVAEFLSLGSGNWFCTSYTRASGAALSSTAALGAGVFVGSYGSLANDGTTDDAAVFAAAIASGAKYINARGLNCAILTQVSLAAGVTLDISGSTITTTGSTLTTFKADTIDDWALIGDGGTIIGAGTTVGTAKALHVVGCNRYLVRGIRAKNIKGHGFYLAPGTPSGTARGDQGVYLDCLAEACYWGWEDTPGDGSEYAVVQGFRTSGCTTWGVKTCAGNIEWTGGHDIDNVGDGFVMVGGTNHAHGIVTGRSINHNGTYNLNASGVINGESFVGCHFYEKIVLLDGCNGITFTGGVIDSPTITVNSGTGSGQCRFQGVFFPNGYGNPAAIGGTDVTSLVLKDCYGPGCPGNNDIALVSKSAAYTYTMNDEGILHPSADTTARTFTIPANASVPYPVGKVLSGVNQNGAGVVTLAITSDTMRLAGAGTTGSRTIAANGNWAAEKVSATEWIVSGNGIT